jgi:hypothetical protein
MRYLKMTTLLACGAALLFVAGCGDATAPTVLEEPEVQVLAQRPSHPPGKPTDPDPEDPPSDEVCWYIGSPKPVSKDHEVISATDFQVVRFGEPNPSYYDGPVVKVPMYLYDDGAYAEEARVGGGYMISAVESHGSPPHRFNMYHEIYLNPEDVPWNDPVCSGVVCETGRILARDQITCRNRPCSTSSRVEFIYSTGEGLLEDFSGSINNNNGLLVDDKEYDGTLLYAWPHGRICVPLS